MDALTIRKHEEGPRLRPYLLDGAYRDRTGGLRLANSRQPGSLAQPCANSGFEDTELDAWDTNGPGFNTWLNNTFGKTQGI